MNGRVYSPSLGRMLSPDPVTQAPENGQNYNRYTYALNNPLTYTDPSGFQFLLPDIGGGAPAGDGGLVSPGGGGGEFNWSLTYTHQTYLTPEPKRSAVDGVDPILGPWRYITIKGYPYVKAYYSQDHLRPGTKAYVAAQAGDQTSNNDEPIDLAGVVGGSEAQAQNTDSLWDALKEGGSAKVGPGAGLHLKEAKAGPLKFGGGVVFGSGGVGVDSGGLSVWGKSTADVQISAGRFGGRAYLWDIDIDSSGVNNIDTFGASRPAWDWSVGVGGTITPYSFELEYNFQPVIDRIRDRR